MSPAGTSHTQKRRGRGQYRRITRPSTSATPYERESLVTNSLSLRSHQPVPSVRTARFTTGRSGADRNRATTTSPGRTRPPRRTSRASPWRRVGTIDGPWTNTGYHGRSTGASLVCWVWARVGFQLRIIANHPGGFDASVASTHSPHHRLGALRPAVRHLRPGAGQDRSRVGQGDQ